MSKPDVRSFHSELGSRPVQICPTTPTSSHPAEHDVARRQLLDRLEALTAELDVVTAASIGFGLISEYLRISQEHEIADWVQRLARSSG